jgi:hypothetical protein
MTNNTISIEYLKTHYSSFDIKIYNTENDIYVPLNLNKYINLLENDLSSNYISLNNKDFIEETTINNILQNTDLHLRPYYTSNIDNDIIFGSKNSYTNLKYNLDTRTFLYILTGSIEITLCPPNYYKYLHVRKNYETLDFFSEIDIHDVSSIHLDNYNKVKFLHVSLKPNQLIYIPPYWFYSIKILSPDTITFVNKYRTFINTMAIIPDMCMQLLQKHNIKYNLTKIIQPNLKY